MKRKEYRRKMDFIQGYRRGFQWKPLRPAKLQKESKDFQRGYIEARKDLKEGEPPIY